MTQKFEIPARDARRIFGDRTITDSLDRMRRFNDYTVPSSSSTEVLRSLQQDAEKDRRWFQRHFMDGVRVAGETLVSGLDLVNRFIADNPVALLSLAHKVQPPAAVGFARSAGVAALARAHPVAAIAVGLTVGTVEIINYSKGGKDAVGRGGSKGAGGRSSSGARRPSSGRIARDHSDVRAFFENSSSELRYLGTRNVKGRNTKIYGDKDGNRYYEDTVHHHVEAFGKNGTHLGEIDPVTRQYCGLADPSKVFKF
jgi:hypothetical protein